MATTSFSNPHISLLRYIKDLEFQDDSYGRNVDEMRLDQIVELSSSPIIKKGVNALTIDMPLYDEQSQYAFVEMAVEATGAGGDRVFAVGFIPYRRPEFPVHVDVLISDGDTADTIKVGDTLL